jgi:MoxR-like ATPase
MPKHAKKFLTIADEVGSIFLERRSAIEAILLGLLTGENVFVLGPPGTGKSALVREIARRILLANYFECLLSKTRPDQAVLGPYDLPALRDTGEFLRRYAGYLPWAHIAFVDEVGKMSPTLGHDLLPLLNERLLHQVSGGNRSTVDVPLISAICASNELIVQESEDAAALWDRLLIRVVVDNIQEPGAFHQLLTMDDNVSSRTEISLADLQEAIEEVRNVKVPDPVIDVVMQLRDALRQAEIIVSDRRWRQCVHLLQASAYLNGRDEATDDDVHVLRYALWDGPEQKTTVERLCLQVSNPLAEKLMSIAEDAEAIARKVREMKGKNNQDKAAYGIEANGKIKLIMTDIAKVERQMKAEGRSLVAVTEVQDRVAAIKQSVLSDLLGMDD